MSKLDKAYEAAMRATKRREHVSQVSASQITKYKESTDRFLASLRSNMEAYAVWRSGLPLWKRAFVTKNPTTDELTRWALKHGHEVPSFSKAGSVEKFLAAPPTHADVKRIMRESLNHPLNRLARRRK